MSVYSGLVSTVLQDQEVVCKDGEYQVFRERPPHALHNSC